MGYIARYSFFCFSQAGLQNRTGGVLSEFLRIQCSRFLLFIEIGRNDHFLYFWLTGLQNRTGGFLSETGKSIFQAIFMIFSHYFMENSWNSVFYLTGLQDRTGGFLPAL
jgi:hypothetical protein